jgi:Arc/MetJ-type ribon-helix-helix transcriptional regulator
MTIKLPNKLEKSIEAVRRGRFACVDDAIAEAARLPLREPAQGQRARPATQTSDAAPDSILGLMRDDDVDWMDSIVADAYRRRREKTWRELDVWAAETGQDPING